MEERIQKILSTYGVTSRRKAEELILQGRVKCNGNLCALGDRADPEVDVITVDGEPLPDMQKRVYIMLNKPKGYVTTLSDEKGRKNAAQLVADCGVRVYPVGRLDLDSEGLLIFTNDGAFADQLMHPKHEVKKTYRVWVKGFCAKAVERLRRPMHLDGYQLRIPDVLVKKDDNNGSGILEITIHEGRNRQVRRMCDAAGMHVTRLRRISEGRLKLGDLPVGKWRYLTDEEVQMLKELGEKNDAV